MRGEVLEVLWAFSGVQGGELDTGQVCTMFWQCHNSSTHRCIGTASSGVPDIGNRLNSVAIHRICSLIRLRFFCVSAISLAAKFLWTCA